MSATPVTLCDPTGLVLARAEVDLPADGSALAIDLPERDDLMQAALEGRPYSLRTADGRDLTVKIEALEPGPAPGLTTLRLVTA